MSDAFEKSSLVPIIVKFMRCILQCYRYLGSTLQNLNYYYIYVSNNICNTKAWWQ